MARRKKARPKQQKRTPDWAKAFQDLYTALGCNTQEDFAARLGFKQGTVSTWLRGDETRKPSADTFIRIAGRAPNPDLAGRFLHLADIADEVIFSVSRKLETGRIQEAGPLVQKGDVVLLRRFRETRRGREEAGPDIPLPVEFIPNPDSTICFVVDGEATAIADCPKALFILDESERDAPNLEPFWGQVVFARYDPGTASNPDPEIRPGIYLGRLILKRADIARAALRGLIAQAILHLLTKIQTVPSIMLGSWVHPDFGELNRATAFDENADKNPQVVTAKQDAEKRVRSELRLRSGWTILGRVLGRLHLEGAENS